MFRPKIVSFHKVQKLSFSKIAVLQLLGFRICLCPVSTLSCLLRDFHQVLKYFTVNTKHAFSFQTSMNTTIKGSHPMLLKHTAGDRIPLYTHCSRKQVTFHHNTSNGSNTSNCYTREYDNFGQGNFSSN